MIRVNFNSLPEETAVLMLAELPPALVGEDQIALKALGFSQTPRL